MEKLVAILSVILFILSNIVGYRSIDEITGKFCFGKWSRPYDNTCWRIIKAFIHMLVAVIGFVGIICRINVRRKALERKEQKRLEQEKELEKKQREERIQNEIFEVEMWQDRERMLKDVRQFLEREVFTDIHFDEKRISVLFWREVSRRPAQIEEFRFSDYGFHSLSKEQIQRVFDYLISEINTNQRLKEKYIVGNNIQTHYPELKDRVGKELWEQWIKMNEAWIFNLVIKRGGNERFYIC